MCPFINDDFLLQNDIASSLYNKFAKDLPIIDYHCHINPEDIAKDVKFSNISDIWFSGDHYKWRLLRAAGVDEKFITGDASPKEKFIAWASVIGKAFGNPLYHWNCLELARYFGIYEPLNEKNAEEIWTITSSLMAEHPERYTARALITNSNVELLCTTDDPIDDLKWHKAIAEDTSFKTRVLPSFRPDKAIDIEKPTYKEYLDKLSNVCGFEINSLASLIRALDSRIDYFNSVGCRIADHGMEYILYATATYDEAEIVFEEGLERELSFEELSKFKAYLLLHCARRYNELNWTMQYHFGCIRNTNEMRFNTLGADCGCDSISGSYNFITPLSSILSTLSTTNELPRTILYSLNPNDNTSIDTLIGCFQGGNTNSPMRIQHGSAWWFNDNMDGMSSQLKSLATQSYLPGFVGMLTDSRSFLSYTRHEYFRRILCNLLGEQIKMGFFPYDEDILKEIITNICYENSKSLFN